MLFTLRDVVVLEALQKFSSKKNVFIVHEHKADRAGLHYDIRIRFGDDDKLYSFATRNLPDMISKTKRVILLIKQPDHDLQYLDVTKMTIPQGEFGAGTMTMFDRGGIKIIDQDDDKVIIQFNGEKLNGKFVIVRSGKENQFYMMSTNK